MKRYEKRLEYKTNKSYKEVNRMKKLGMSGQMAEAYLYELFKKEGVIYEQRQKGLFMFSSYNKKYK